MYRNPVVDMTTLHAVESLFSSDTAIDPWATELLGDLVDSYIYGNEIKFISPIENLSIDPATIKLPRIVRAINAHGAVKTVPRLYDLSTQPSIDNQYMDEFISFFSKWIHKNKTAVKIWTKLHKSSYIQDQHLSRIKRNSVFDMDRLWREHQHLVNDVLSRSFIKQDAFFYMLDIVMRYPLYGALIEKSETYLNHPVRDAYCGSYISYRKSGDENVPVSFKRWGQKRAREIPLEKFIAELTEIRDFVHNTGLHETNKILSNEEVREHLSMSNIPAYVKAPVLNSILLGAGIGAGIIGEELGNLATGVLATVVVTAPTLVWPDIKLPGQVNKIEWLRWAMHWPEIENPKKS